MATTLISNIRGPQGIQGATGAQGPIGNTGPTGAQGPTGPTGSQGPAGTGITMMGSVANQAALTALQPAPQGNAYLNQTDDSLWIADATGTFISGGSIQGPVGPQGIQGIQGVVGATGAQGIQGPDGVAGAVGPTGPTGQTGPTGVRGAQWFVGSGAPPATITNSLPGDMYLDTVTGDVYQVS